MSYQLLQPVLWAVSGLAAVVLAVLAYRRRGLRLRGSPLAVGAVALAVFALLVVPAVGIVPAGHRGVVYEWGGGVNPAERGEGFTLLAPWIQTMRTSSVRTQKVFSAKVYSQSLDLQEITVVASVNYHVQPTLAAELYQEVGPRYRETVIQPALYQRTKAAVGQVRAEHFAKKRGELAKTIQARLTSQLAGYGIVVEYVNIEDAIFDPAFVKAVKEKIIAEQEAARQENLIAAKAAEKEQTIITAEATARKTLIEAEAQAKANRVIEASLAPKVLRWKWLTTWSGALPTTLVGDKDVALFLGGEPPSASYGYGP